MQLKNWTSIDPLPSRICQSSLQEQKWNTTVRVVVLLQTLIRVVCHHSVRHIAPAVGQTVTSATNGGNDSGERCEDDSDGSERGLFLFMFILLSPLNTD